MLKINVDKKSINRIEDLANFVDTIPTKLKMANSRAGAMAVREIESNIRRRGRAGRAVGVSYESYGEFGLKFSIRVGGSRGGNTGGRSKSGRYSILIASRIFLNSEEGKVGRRAFTLPYGTYKISHTSGRWSKGRFFTSSPVIPEIGPFYFSSKAGMKPEKISTTSRRIIKEYLNRYYDNALNRVIK